MFHDDNKTSVLFKNDSKVNLTLLQDLDRNLSRLTASFEKAIAEKARCQEEVNQTNKTIELANKLVKELEASWPFLPSSRGFFYLYLLSMVSK